MWYINDVDRRAAMSVVSTCEPRTAADVSGQNKRLGGYEMTPSNVCGVDSIESGASCHPWSSYSGPSAYEARYRVAEADMCLALMRRSGRGFIKYDILCL